MQRVPIRYYNTVLLDCLRQRQLSATAWIVELVPPCVDVQAWVDYRRQLEALPQHPGWPINFDWPSPPRDSVV